jgi:hypothetical protein
MRAYQEFWNIAKVTNIANHLSGLHIYVSTLKLTVEAIPEVMAVHTLSVLPCHAVLEAGNPPDAIYTIPPKPTKLAVLRSGVGVHFTLHYTLEDSWGVCRSARPSFVNLSNNPSIVQCIQ